ncbi:MAG: IPT/TIG domain-containing protein, partial [Alistipes sp.]|nr:IPT/TIG domain-containing protein [Alistipes sp.]
MKKSIKHLISIVAAAALMLPVSCDKTYVEEVVVSAPRIDSFEPMSAPVGSEIVVTGAFLNDVVTATIGGVEVTILERVSSSRLSILASGEAKSGVISLTNAAGVGESAEAFTYTYVAPEITTSILQTTVDMGDQMLIAGKYMGAAEAVIFTAEGYTEGHEAQIITQSASELVVKCPYVEESQARITLRYFNGTTSVETSLETAPVIEVMRYKPQFDTPTFVRTDVGRSVKLTGSYLDKVDKILVGGFEAQCFKSHSELSFTVPAGDFGDGETTTDVKAVYFDGNEETILSEAFVVYVPFVKFWENMRTWGQGRDVEALSSFFSPETGQVYANSDWREKVDP